MNAPNDFSRRFFADFIASRIKAWSLEAGRPPSPSRPVAGPNRPAGAANPEAEVEAGPANPGRDGRPLRRPGRSDRQHSPDQGIG